MRVTQPIKDGNIVKYTLRVKQRDGLRMLDLKEKLERSVERQYDDFEWLHHSFLTHVDTAGLIVPPLPPRPIVKPNDAQSKSKKQLGNSSKVLIADEFYKDCKSLERYLKQLTGHSVFGNDPVLERFLTETKPLPRSWVKKGLLDKLSTVMDGAKKMGHQDIDDYFQKEWTAANNYSACIRQASNNFNKMVYSQQRLAGAYCHLSTTLNIGGSCTDSRNTAAFYRLLVALAEALDDGKQGLDVDVFNADSTLGFHLDLTTRYTDSHKEMLYGRTCLLINYEDANRALSKAKPHKVAAAEEAKKSVEQAFEACSETARRELKDYHRQRIFAFQEALTVYAEAKITTARDTYALLAKSLTHFKQFAG